MSRHPGYSNSGFAAGYMTARVLPRRVCRLIGKAMGRLSYNTREESRDALRANLATVTGLEGAALDTICERNFENFGMMLADYFYYTGKSGSKIQRLLDRWNGLDHLHTALDAGRGVLLVTAHMGNWELGGTLLSIDGWPVNVVTLEEPTGELTRTRDDYRRRLGIRTIAVGDGNMFSFVEMIAALKRNEIVCMLVDRPYGDTGIPVDFFNRPTCFSSAPALLHQHTGAAVIPAFLLHNAESRYDAFALSPIDMESSEDRRAILAQNTQKIATAFESIIRNHPDQWYNYVPIWK